MKNRVIGLDIAKNVFHCVDQDGKRKKLKRAGVLQYFSNLEVTTVAMEACGSAYY